MVVDVRLLLVATNAALCMNISTIQSRPLLWLKNTNKLQWINQVLCSSNSNGGIVVCNES